MIKFVIAIFILAAPFVLVGFSKDKKRGFLRVLLFSLLFHIALGFSLQLFGMFYYSAVLAATGTAAAICLAAYVYYAVKKRLPIFFPSIHPITPETLRNIAKKTDWLLFGVILISVLSLYPVHYNYTGKISLAGDKSNEYHYVRNMKYVYPYFSDEWYSVSLIEETISTGELPLKNALTGEFFPNLEIFTHSFLAEIIVLAGLNPLLHYTLLSVAVNTLIIVLAYLFLRIANVSGLSSSLAALAILYITSAANLPGIWNLIPITFGVLFSLMLFCFIALADKKMVVLTALPISLFYPLLLPFYGTAMAAFFLSRYSGSKEKIFARTIWITGFFALLFFLLIIILLNSPLAEFTKYLFSRLWYYNLLGGFTPQMNVFYIIPLPIIFLALVGAPFLFKNQKWILTQAAIGGAYWISYFFTPYRFVLEFERAVFFTSIVVALAAGFGMESLSKRLNFSLGGKVKVFAVAQMLCLAALLLFAPLYTRRENWTKLVAINSASGQIAYPRAPANNYLTEDDLRIFKDIKEKKFLSVPWKGTVIGVATKNRPVATKEGTISVGNAEVINSFLRANCQEKEGIAKKLDLDYIYLPDFQCPGFEKIDKSKESFVLYKIK